MGEWYYTETTTYLDAAEPPRGASLKALERRVKYGGRKGRRAWQRILKYPMPIVTGIWMRPPPNSNEQTKDNG